MAQDAHRQVLVAMSLLEDKIERLSHSVSHGHQWLRSWRQSGSHRHSCNYHQRRSRAVDQHSGESPTSSHHATWRIQSPSPSHSRQQVTFEDSPSVKATVLGRWNCTGRSHRLITAQRRRFGMPTHVRAPGSRIPQWGGTILGQWRTQERPWLTGNAQTIPRGQ